MPRDAHMHPFESALEEMQCRGKVLAEKLQQESFQQYSCAS